MKYLVLLLTIITLTVYCTNRQIEGNKATCIINKPNERTSIIGEWSICSTISSDRISILYNACTKVNFNIDNTAIVTIPSGDKEILQWRQNNNKLTLTNIKSKNKTQTYFDDSEYEMVFTSKKDYTELKLIQSKINYTYVLGGS